MHRKNTALHPRVVFFRVCVTNSADVDIETAVEPWYDVEMTIDGSFTSLFLLRTINENQKIGITLESVDGELLHAGCAAALTC